MAELEVRQQPKTRPDIPEVPLQANPGRTSLADLDGGDVETTAPTETVASTPEPVNVQQRQDDRAVIAAAERKLVETVENERVAVAQRKAALRDLLCTQRGIDYARLPTGDATRVAIDKEVEERFARIVQDQRDEATRAKLDKQIDNTKLSREARLKAFYEKYLLDRGVRQVTTKPVEEQTRLRSDFEQGGGVARFDLRDQVTRDNAKQRAIVKNRANAAATRLAAYQALYRNNAALAAGVAWSAMKPEQQSAIDARFQAEVVPQFEAAEAAAKKQEVNEAKAKALEAQLRPKATWVSMAWGRYKKIVVPEREDVYRQILVLRSGRASSDPLIEKKVAVYRKAVAEQNAASAKALSAAYYYDIGVRNMNAITKEDISRLWGNVSFNGISLADAMFGSETNGVLIAPSQQAPIRIRAAAILKGGEKEELIGQRTWKINDLVAPIVLLTPEVMNHYLDKVLLPAARQLLSGDDQAALMEAVLVAYKQDLKEGSYETGTVSFDAQMKLATGAIGPKPVTVDGAPVDLGDKNSQGATISWTQAERMKGPIQEAQLAVDEQQKKLDEIKAYEKQESERRQAEQLERLKNNPRMLNLVGTGPGYVDPRRAEAEAELEKRKGILARRQQVQQSFTQQAMDLKFGTIKLEDVQLDLKSKLQATSDQIAKYEGELEKAKVALVQQREIQKSESKSSVGDLGGTGYRGGLAITTADAERKVEEIGEHIASLKEQRKELEGYVGDASSGALPPPIRMQELQKKLDTGYRFIPTAERFGRAILAGAEEAAAFVTRVFAGLVDVSIPGIIEHGGNGVLSLLGSDARLNLGIGWATANIRDGAKWLEGNAQYQMDQTGGGLDVEIIKGLTTAAILYLPTMGFGSVGAAIGGAIRATQMAELLGSSVALGTMGALAALDKSPGDMARSVIPMAALPMFGAAFKSIGGKLIAGFFSNMTSDILVSADYSAAINVMKGGGTIEAAIKAAGKSVNWERAIAQGLVAVGQEAHGIVKTQSKPQLAEDGMPIVVREAADGKTPHEYYRFKSEGGKGEWVKVDAQSALAQAAKTQRPPVRVTEGELGAIMKGGDPAMQALQIAESRSKQVDSWGGEVKAKEDQIAALDRKVDATAEQKQLRTELATELERAKATEDVLRLSEKQAEIDASLVEKAGQAPSGYVLDAATKKWKFSADVQQKQITAKSAEITALENARSAYEHELAELYRLRGGKKTAKTDEQITAQAAKVKAAQETYLAVGGDPSLVKEVQQARQDLAQATKQAEVEKPKPLETVKREELPTKPIPDDAKPWVEAEDGRQIFKRGDETFVDQNGRVTDSDGTLIDAQGRSIDVYGRYVDGAGRLIDVDFNLINEAGQKVDASGKVIEVGVKASQSEREIITAAFKQKFGDKVIAYRGIRVPKGTKVDGTYTGGSGHGQMVVFDADSALHYAKNPAFDPPAGFAAADEIVIIQFELTADLVAHDPYAFTDPMKHVFVGKDTDITTLPGYKETRFSLGEVTSQTQAKLAAQIENRPLVAPTSGGGTNPNPPTVEAVPTSRTRAESSEIPPPEQRPPGMDDEIIAGIAKRGEAWANNKLEGTCASAAMKNTISAQLRGMDAYVMEFEGLSGVKRMLQRFNLDGGQLERLLEKAGVEMHGAHAIAAIKGTDGVWRFLSWGRVELDWEIYAREVFGDSYQLRGQGSNGKIGEWTTGDHVRWMVAHRWEYPHPTMGKVMRALLGWNISTGK